MGFVPHLLSNDPGNNIDGIYEIVPGRTRKSSRDCQAKRFLFPENRGNWDRREHGGSPQVNGDASEAAFTITRRITDDKVNAKRALSKRQYRHKCHQIDIEVYCILLMGFFKNRRNRIIDGYLSGMVVAGVSQRTITNVHFAAAAKYGQDNGGVIYPDMRD